MWTLIIITIAFSGALSGASSSTAYFPISRNVKLQATAIGAPDWIRVSPQKPPVALSNRRRLAATSSSPDACSVEPGPGSHA